MKDLAGRLSEAAGAAFAKLGLDAGLGAMRRSDRPDLADFQCNGAMAAAKAAKKNPREIAGAVVEDAEGLAAGGERGGGGAGLHQRAAERGGAGRARARRSRRTSGRGRCTGRDAAAGGDGFRRLERRQGNAHRPPALDGDRRQPAAAVPLHGRSGDQRRASRRLGAADGPAHQRGEAGAAAASLFRRRLHRALSAGEPGDDGRSRAALSAGVGQVEDRRGAPRGGPQGDGGAAGRTAGLSRAVAAFLQRDARGAGARVRQPRRDVRPVEGRERRRAARSGDRGRPEGPRHRRAGRRRAGSSAWPARATGRRCRRSSW